MPRETVSERAERARRIALALERAYPSARIALDFGTPFELLIATILSAQCTDAKVNQVTPALFRRYPSPRAMADADPTELEQLIHPTGFYRQKAKSLLAASRDIAERFGGETPDTLEALTSLRGVARKTANVVRGNAFGIPGLAIDTHMKRVHQRLGLTTSDDPVAIERDVAKLVPEPQWTDYTHRVIHHGRVSCTAKRPQCETCPLREDCPWPDSRAAKRSAPGRRASNPRGRAAQTTGRTRPRGAGN